MVQYSIVLFSTAKYSTVSTVQYSTVQYSTVSNHLPGVVLSSNTHQTYHGTLTKVSVKSIQILPRSYREKYILFPVTPGKYGIVPFFSYNLTRVSSKVH